MMIQLCDCVYVCMHLVVRVYESGSVTCVVRAREEQNNLEIQEKGADKPEYVSTHI